MAAVGENIFTKKGNFNDNDSDIWDDTALIQAYDNAVNLMKAQIPDYDHKQSVPGNSTAGRTSSKKKKKKGKNKQKSADKSLTNTKWKVGDHCRAVYTDDGDIYESVILSVDSSNNQCVVRYLGYGNEEEQELRDLLPSEAVGQERKYSFSETLSESDVGMDWNYTQKRRSSNSSRGGRGRGRMTPPFSMPPPLGRPPFPQPPPPPPPFTQPQSQWPGFPMSMPSNPFMSFPFMPPMFPSSPMSAGPTRPEPQFMPPPPPVDDVEDLENDKEALHSMLIAWYMSGYHTGYYQGLKEGKKSQQKSPGKEKTTEAQETS